MNKAIWFLNTTTVPNLEYCIEIATGRMSGPVAPSDPNSMSISDGLTVPYPPDARSDGWLTPSGFNSRALWLADLSYDNQLVWASPSSSSAESLAALRTSVDAAGGGDLPAGNVEWRNYTDYPVQWLYLNDNFLEVSGKLDPRSSTRQSLPAGVTYYGWIVSNFTGRMLRTMGSVPGLACQLTLDNQRIQASQQ